MDCLSVLLYIFSDFQTNPLKQQKKKSICFLKECDPLVVIQALLLNSVHPTGI